MSDPNCFCLRSGGGCRHARWGATGYGGHDFCSSALLDRHDNAVLQHEGARGAAALDHLLTSKIFEKRPALIGFYELAQALSAILNTASTARIRRLAHEVRLSRPAALLP